MNEGKFYSKSDILNLLDQNDRAVERAIIAIWARQTESEKLNRHTAEKNHIGFSAFDAEFLTSLAERLVWKGLRLSPKQIAAGRRAIRKYAGQLADMANGKVSSKVEKESNVVSMDASDATYDKDGNVIFPDKMVITPSQLREVIVPDEGIVRWEYYHNWAHKTYILYND